VTRKLDYLADLGVTCRWVLPFYPSPDRDNGYDVKDYYGVDPRFGTLEELEVFLRAAGERGLRVVIDLILNHTSDQHPWFQAARRDPKSRFRDYYVWADNPPPVPPEARSIFPGAEDTVWTFDDRAGAYYYHRFYHFQPELRMANPEVRDEVRRVMDFWLSFPVAGFRVDAASHMIEAKGGLKETEPDDPHGILREFHQFAQERKGDVVFIGEADVPLADAAAFFGDGDELNLIFNFLLDNDLFLALATESAEPIVRCLKELPSIPERGQWLNFLRNLDELDLERLSDAERADVYEAFAPDEDMRIYGRGIRRRLAPMLGHDRRRLELAFSLLFSLPGAPVIVYGDEIGMGDDLTQPERNSVRSPMQWSADRNAGFSTAPRDRLVRPIIASRDFGPEEVNVADQQEDPKSLLQWMKALIRTRRQTPEIGLGSYQVLCAKPDCVLVHLCDWKGSRLLAVHNLSGKEQVASMDLAGHATELEAVFGIASVESERDTYRFRLAPYGYGWFRTRSKD
jgi:maltose alpha-D-glucosyltransferase/alpha-amylase